MLALVSSKPKLFNFKWGLNLNLYEQLFFLLDISMSPHKMASTAEMSWFIDAEWLVIDLSKFDA